MAKALPGDIEKSTALKLLKLKIFSWSCQKSSEFLLPGAKLEYPLQKVKALVISQQLQVAQNAEVHTTVRTASSSGEKQGHRRHWKHSDIKIEEILFEMAKLSKDLVT